MTDLEEYEKAYLERLKKKSGKNSKPKQTEHFEEVLEPLDYVILGLVFCNDMFLNELLLTNGHAEISTYFCDKSEYGNTDWARAYGC